MKAELILSLCGACLALPAAAAVLIASRRPGGRRPFLSLVFLEVGLYFISELISALWGKNVLSLALNFGSALYSLPSLYFFARDALGEKEPPLIRHYLPALANALIGTALAIPCAARGYRAGWGTALYLVAVELGQTVQLFAYGGAALRLASAKARGGASPWPKRAVLAALVGFGGFLALSWAGLGFTAATEILGRRIPAPEGFGVSSVLVVVLLAWTLGLCALWGKDYSEARKAEGPKYGGRPLRSEEAAGLLRRARALLAAEPDLASPAVEPRRIAARLGLPYYLLSRAVNEGEGMTVGELVNGYRVERAKRLLIERQDLGALEVALESGFQAKSTFNDVFRKATGMSPGEYRSSVLRTGKN
jgi:AraC-like DNA-binding protein